MGRDEVRTSYLCVANCLVDGSYRKVEGEAKGEAHGEGAAVRGGVNIPLRRWEDWERSRLRKLRREEKRRREFEKQHGSYMTANGELSVRSDTYSQYDGSDTMSITSSEDDHWGTQIGGYNENHPLYPPPPVGLNARAMVSAESIAASDLEAMLEVGFDDGKPRSSKPMDGRYQQGNGYTPLSRSTSPGRESPISPLRPTNAVSSARDEHQTHAKKRSGGRSGPRDYGPLGPLDPGSRF